MTSPFSLFICVARVVMDVCVAGMPKWASDYSLEVRGCYCEGFVDDYDLVLSQHCMESVTTYGVRKSKRNVSVEDKENESKASYPLNVVSTHLHKLYYR